MVLRFDKKSYSNTILGFSACWDYKNYKGYGKEYYSGKNRSLSIIDGIHLKCDCIDGGVINGIQEPNLYFFVLDKTSGYKVFCKPETIHYKRINRSVLNTLTFYPEDYDHEEVTFNGENIDFYITNDQNLDKKTNLFKSIAITIFIWFVIFFKRHSTNTTFQMLIKLKILLFLYKLYFIRIILVLCIQPHLPLLFSDI